jgi:hypothetical protein
VHDKSAEDDEECVLRERREGRRKRERRRREGRDREEEKEGERGGAEDNVRVQTEWCIM